MQRQDDGGVHRQHRLDLGACGPSPDTAAYGAAKAGLVNLTQTLAMEWAPEGAGEHGDRRARR